MCEAVKDGPMTSIDRYTKVMLTVIAASLVWLCFSSGSVEIRSRRSQTNSE